MISSTSCRAILVLAALVASALPAHAADVRSFALVGVRLGMTSDQALRVVTPLAHAVDGKPGPPTVTKAPCFAPHPSPSQPEDCLTKIAAYVGRGFLTVSLIEDYPDRPGTTIVVGLSFTDELPDAPQPVDAYRATVETRFGPPTLVGRGVGGPVLLWCNGPKRACNAGSDANGKPPQVAQLSFSREAFLTINDRQTASSRRAALRRASASATR